MISNIKKMEFQSPGLENEHFIQLSENFTNKTHITNFPPIYLSIHIWLLDFCFKTNLSLLNININISNICSCWRGQWRWSASVTESADHASSRLAGGLSLHSEWWVLQTTNYPPPPPAYRPLRSDWPTFNFCPAWKAELVSVLLSPH